ncbi:poly [ADP-ribose] polymerase 1-like isoform X5 [Populus trichocarpa]|uniref:poly [ADP-ribose] polymerase 1-like isoform X5 n=1 Tax=Populus trichocarpa TaxID=3694 RepID=UPI002279D390|nr:poly [ADP-ribose] polymerase 1-like isoform X5 [Populus trichocarpa]
MEDAGGKASCKMVQRPDHLLDYTTSSNHADRTPNNTQLVDAAAIESHQHQYQKLTKYDGDSATLVIDTATKYGIEVSQDSLATCWECSQKIMKGEVVFNVRVFLRVEGQASKRLLLDHANCFMNLYPSIQVEKLAGWETLPASDQEAVLLLVKKVPPAALTDIKDMGKEDRELPQSASKTGTKRRKDLDGDQNLKVAKAELDVITSRAAFASAKNTNDWEPKLMAQSKDSWSLAEECKRDCQFGTEKKLQLEPINAKALPETSCKTMPEASGAPDFVEAASKWSATESKEECKDKKEALSDYVIDKIDKDIADMADKGCTIDNGGLDYKLFLLRGI